MPLLPSNRARSPGRLWVTILEPPTTGARQLTLRFRKETLQRRTLLRRASSRPMAYEKLITIRSPRSARASNVGGIVIPSALAVLILITSSNFVGCSTRQLGSVCRL